MRRVSNFSDDGAMADALASRLGWPAMSQSRVLRLATLSSLYFCQGVPIGLMSNAMPAWLLSMGTSAEAVGSFKAVSGLPWSLKFFVAPLMDMCTCRRYGFRRPFVCAAQSGLLLALITMALMTKAELHLSVITTCGFLVNFFSSSQDVAVDGMAIDILDADEHGVANAFMSTSQTAGATVLGVLSGALLPSIGLSGAASVAAAFILPALLNIFFSLERPGQRHVPHCSCTGDEQVTQSASWSPPPEATLSSKAISFVRGLLLNSTSLLILTANITSTVASGIGSVMWPKVGLDHGVSAPAYATIVSVADGLAALVGLACGGLIDRYGAAPLYLISTGLNIAPFATVAYLEQTSGLTANAFVALRVCTSLVSQVRFVSYLAFCMRICGPSLAAATQFAAMMALSNLGGTIGDTLVAVGSCNSPASYFTLCAEAASLSTVMGILLLVSVKHGDARKQVDGDHQPAARILV